VHLQEGRLAEAAGYLEKAALLRPDKPEYRRELLDVLLQLGRCEAALPHFEALLAGRVAEYRDHLYYGDCLARMGRTADAADAYRRGEAFCRERLAARGDDADGWIGLGYMLRRQGRLPEALQAFLRAAQRAPDSPDALLQAGELLAMAGRDQEARAFLSRFVARYPQDARAPAVRERLAGR
jgi:tetratricopeptide (TPR) repeat protein